MKQLKEEDVEEEGLDEEGEDVEEEDENDYVKIEVSDTGYGISPENMHKLFTPFFTTKQAVKGVGLGLAVSYGIIQRHHGRIEVQSKEQTGTTFAVYLPQKIEESGQTSPNR